MSLVQMLSQFRSNFGDDEGNEVTDFAGTIPSALLMMNSNYTSAQTSAAQRISALGELLAKHPTPTPTTPPTRRFSLGQPAPHRQTPLDADR